MIFRPDLARLVMDGKKTVTRRRMSDNPGSPWWAGGCKLRTDRKHGYAVCPGRSRTAIGRVKVLSVGPVRLGDITDEEARREGFADTRSFCEEWAEINGFFDPDEVVWRVEFERW